MPLKWTYDAGGQCASLKINIAGLRMLRFWCFQIEMTFEHFPVSVLSDHSLITINLPTERPQRSGNKYSIAHGGVSTKTFLRTRWLPRRAASVNLICMYTKRCLRKSKEEHYQQEIGECGTDQKKLFKVLNGLMHRDSPRPLPTDDSDNALVERFTDFFTDKIRKIRTDLLAA
ncbi:hypothetical protein CAPTEDRAFT_215814 [Capitella teleta]|uniref:Uncharacterized protein n=1 Tax=Capitella teleta TaxID=283909 RepID=R7USE8_CAPTE|nr:hypothetical protein CAPTEDRAFT_215814 [Capitella teleta]|eukprot:ELU06852.1 hypothetical protein CAPTEDRAFT_215814 [Capitella teleta]